MAAEAFAFVQPQQKEKDEQHRKRLVKLRRMQITIGGHPRDFVAQLGKLDAPRQCGWFTPATTRSETTLAPEEVADGDSRCARVRGFPPGELVTFHQEVTDRDGAEQAAVKDTAGAQEVERDELQRMIAILGFGEEHQDLRADEPPEQHPQTQVVDALARQSVAGREACCDQDGAEKREGEKDAVSVDGETADTNNFRVHKLNQPQIYADERGLRLLLFAFICVDLRLKTRS